MNAAEISNNSCLEYSVIGINSQVMQQLILVIEAHVTALMDVEFLRFYLHCKSACMRSANYKHQKITQQTSHSQAHTQKYCSKAARSLFLVVIVAMRSHNHETRSTQLAIGETEQELEQDIPHIRRN